MRAEVKALIAAHFEKMGPFEGFRRRDRDRPRTPEKNLAAKKPAESKGEPVTKN
jgi:hypothetical protein